MTTDDIHSLGACLKHWRLQRGWPLEVVALKTRIPAKYLRALESNDFTMLPPIEPLHHTLGESLREYRERQGLSIESIAERTRVPLASLQALEENQSKNLPDAPVIIRAFVEAYLNCLTVQEAEKEIVLIQLAKMVEIVYTKPKQDPTDSPPSVGVQAHRLADTSFNSWPDRLHNHVLGVYVRLARWRTTFCRRTVSAGQISLAYTGRLLSHASSLSAQAGRTSLAYAEHLLDRAGSASVQASRTASHRIAAYSVELMARTRPDGGWPALRQRTRNGLTAGAQQTWGAIALGYRFLTPLLQWSLIRQHLIKSGLTSEQTPAATPQRTRPIEGKTWVWLVQYGTTVLLLLMLGSTAATIPLFKETGVADTKLAASNLVEFIGYGGALLMVWLMGRNTVAQLDRSWNGFAVLRPLGAPFTALLVVSASYKILLTLVGPFLGKTDRLAYNWIFVSLILAATLWLIRTWFFKSAPLLESFESTGRTKQPGDIAVVAIRD